MKYKIYSNGKEISDQQTISLLRDESAGVFESMRLITGGFSSGRTFGQVARVGENGRV